MPPVVNSSSMQVDFSELMKEAKELIEKKDKIEEELRDLEDQLVTAGIGMEEPLVDRSGFPRSEIDVHSVRTSRNLIIRLRNDHKTVMADIENILHRIHEAKRQEQQQEETTAAATTSTTQQQQQETTSTEDTTMTEVPVPFAIVNAVAPDSPAYLAGLRRNDSIIKFGHINVSNHQRLQALNVLISTSENQAVSITLLRDGQTMDVTVTPRSGWGGRGTLGCHLLPL
jgi:26S proteasome non-ATPase regulatory subunit 9